MLRAYNVFTVALGHLENPMATKIIDGVTYTTKFGFISPKGPVSREELGRITLKDVRQGALNAAWYSRWESVHFQSVEWFGPFNTSRDALDWAKDDFEGSAAEPGE